MKVFDVISNLRDDTGIAFYESPVPSAEYMNRQRIPFHYLNREVEYIKPQAGFYGETDSKYPVLLIWLKPEKE